MRKRTSFVGAAAAVALCTSMALVAQDTQEAAAPSEEMMARMAPGPMHRALDPLVGTWSMAGKWRMAPDAPWEEFEATAVREWVLDGRFVRETITSEFMGQPYEGIGYFGYDNTREEFTTVYVGNMSTSMGTSTGQMDGDKLVLEGVNADPMTGEREKWQRTILDFSGEEHTYTGILKDAEGNEYASMEMVATKD